MNLLPHLHEAFLNLFSSKLRSLLALLGILVGTASVVAMVSGGQLATNEAIKQFKSLGTDLLALTINESIKESPKKSDSLEMLTLDEANGLASLNNTVLEVAPYTQLFNFIQIAGREVNANILGVTQRFANVIHIEIAKGRFISDLDRYNAYCVLGHSLYQELKKTTLTDPVGQQIKVGKNIFTIIGVAKPWPESSFLYTNIDSSIMIPILTSTSLSKYATINNIVIRLQPNTDIDLAKQQIKDYIDQRLANKQLFFRSAKELIVRMSKQSEIMTIFLGLIGSVSLIVGGIGVMNIMLVSVVERRREIGIRLAIGAKRSDIRLLFLVEAIMLSLSGGFLGVIIGLMIEYGIALFSHWEFIFFLLPPSIGFTVSVVVGIFFGFYPAYKASQLNPIDALRSE